MSTDTDAERRVYRGPVGFIGLGRVGGAGARSILAAGVPVVGYRRGPADALVAAGGTAATSVYEVAERCEVIVLAVPSAQALWEVTEGPGGLCSAAMREGAMVVDLTTADRAAKERARAALAAAGAEMLDCPVGGTPGPDGPPRMDSMFASGTREGVERCRVVLEMLAVDVRYVGDFGNGITAKLVTHTLVALNTLALGEALALARRAGLDLDMLLDVLESSPGDSWVLRERGRRMLEGPYAPARGSIDTMRDVIAVIGRLADQFAAQMPLLDLARLRYAEASRRGWGDDDIAGVFRLTDDQESRT